MIHHEKPDDPALSDPADAHDPAIDDEVALLSAIALGDLSGGAALAGTTTEVDLEALTPTEKRVVLALMRERFGGVEATPAPPGEAPDAD